MGLCQWCFAQPATLYAAFCGHKVICGDCEPTFSMRSRRNSVGYLKCPVCKGAIHGFVKTRSPPNSGAGHANTSAAHANTSAAHANASPAHTNASAAHANASAAHANTSAAAAAEDDTEVEDADDNKSHTPCGTQPRGGA